MTATVRQMVRRVLALVPHHRAADIARSDEPDRRDRASSPECDGLGLAAGPYASSRGAAPWQTTRARPPPRRRRPPLASPPVAAGPEGGATDPRVADHRGGRREPQSLGRQRRAAVDRRRVRRLADLAGPGGGRLLPGPRRIGPVAWSHRRPIRPQDAAPPRRRAFDSGLPGGGVRAEHRGADRCAHRRRCLRRHGVPDHPRADHGTVGAGAGTDAFDCPVVGPRRRDRVARPARVGVPARELRVGVGVPGHAAARSRRPLHGVAVRAGARERDDRPGRQPRRHPVRASWSGR